VEAVSTQLFAGLRASIPVALTALAVLAAYLPFGSAALSRTWPEFWLMSVFFWSVYQPNLMPAGAAFLIGFLNDVLSGMPLGLTALTLVLLQYAALHQRRAFVGQPFLVGWVGFAVLAAVAMVLMWFGASLYYFRLFEPSPVAVKLAITVAVYPLVAEFLGWLQRRFLLEGRHGS
jgi:rod shape-determining protein MreD